MLAFSVAAISLVLSGLVASRRMNMAAFWTNSSARSDHGDGAGVW